MPDYSYTLYDTVIMGNAANVEHILFQIAQGADATHTEGFTNARGAGVLPNQEAFSIKRIAVAVDVLGAVADAKETFVGNVLELVVSNKSVLKLPLLRCAGHNSYGGHFTQAVAADQSLIGLAGDGYMLEIPIEIPGGTQFRVRVLQVNALSAASQNVKVMLDGILTMQ